MVTNREKFDLVVEKIRKQAIEKFGSPPNESVIPAKKQILDYYLFYEQNKPGNIKYDAAITSMVSTYISVLQERLRCLAEHYFGLSYEKFINELDEFKMNGVINNNYVRHNMDAVYNKYLF